LMPKLENRRVDCEKRLKMSKKKPVLEMAKLSYGPHPKIPQMANCLELAVDEKFGRHIITKRDLRVGDVLTFEKPIDHVLRPDYKYRRCATCLSENDLTLISCPDCTSTMFCSPVCFTSGYEKFHKYECPIIETVSKCMDLTLQLPLRVILALIHEYKTVEVLASVVEEMNGKDSDYTILTKYYDQAGMDKREMLKAFHMLENNIDKRSNMEMFEAGIELGHAFNLFIENTELKQLFKTKVQRDLLLNLWFRYMFVCQTNNYSLDALARRPTNGECKK
jgi:SET and MYND domain-containing protein 4